jgi:hypothetical protein
MLPENKNSVRLHFQNRDMEDASPNTRARAESELIRGQSATHSQKEFERGNAVTQNCCGFRCVTATKILIYVLSVFSILMATGIIYYELLHQSPCACCGWNLEFATGLIMFVLGFWMPSPGD